MSLFSGILGRRKGEAALSGEQGLSLCDIGSVLFHHAHELCEDASYGPDVNSRPVVFFQEDNLRGAVPSGLHMPRKLSFHISSGLLRLDQLLGHLLLFFFIHCRIIFLVSLHLLLLLLWLTHTHATAPRPGQAVAMSRRLNILLFVNFGQNHGGRRNA